MNWLDNVELYLKLKLDSNPSRHSFGIKFLGNYPEGPENLRVFGQIAHQIISAQATTIEGVTSCKLTNVSIAIGKRIISILTNPRLHDWKDEVRLGDSLVEVFYQLGYIDIVKPKFKSTKPVEIVLLPEFPSELPEEAIKMGLHGTWSERPRVINRAEQIIQFDKDTPRYSKAIIKRWDEKLDGLFKNLLNTKAIIALNKLQQVGWCIDKDILEAITKNPHVFYKKGDKSSENKSKIIDYNYTIAKAKALSEVEEFFYALDMDYRGRIYYVESYMNFQGSDLARGVLRFSERRSVTPEGLRWIKIHCASSYNESYNINDIPQWCTSDYKSHLESEGLEDISVDKMTLKDRELWCDNNIDKIYETAINKKLHDCEKPVSFLSAAIEIYNYNHCDDVYYSNLPIPIDGSNNGWQHLGAISKDIETGKLVGLVPVDIQNDFYVQTAKKLIEITKDDERQSILSDMPMKKIRKGISKRGSMTRAYSAGAQKIAENMYNDCKQAGYVAQYGITEEHCKGFARDLVKAIQLVCPGPLKTMKFLQKLAQAKLDEGWGYITWVTPSGFPVIYTCQHQVSERQRGSIQGLGQINHVAKVDSVNPDVRGFMCGISPNFIHSQDASHMSLVIAEFDGPFGAVHDSFSTHASDVDELCQLTKDVFVDMYNKPNYFDIIEGRLGATAEQPELGNLNIEDVKKSDYFFA
jgi:DNA-directed RNA polymerase